MATAKPFPKTLLEAVTYFADADLALAFMVNVRWPDGVCCPYCGSDDTPFVKSRRIWQCKGCRKQFSAKVGTIFEDSPIPLTKWWPAYWMLLNDKNGISSYELARALGVTQKTGWFMLHRLRLAMQTRSFAKMSGDVEADETYIGGKARNMHAAKRKRLEVRRGRSIAGKVAVMALLERHGKDGVSQVRTEVLTSLRKRHVQGHVRNHVEPGSSLHTDSYSSYVGLNKNYVHNVIDHAECYVDGNVHTNSCENFWSLLKRAIKGTYVSIEPFHLFRYLDEQAFRFNSRKLTDAERFLKACMSIVGRRLTYTALTGRELPQTC